MDKYPHDKSPMSDEEWYQLNKKSHAESLEKLSLLEQRQANGEDVADEIAKLTALIKATEEIIRNYENPTD